MFYKSRKLNIIKQRVMTIIKIVICSLFDIIKLILSPLYLLVKVIKWQFKPTGRSFSTSSKRKRFNKMMARKRWDTQNHRVNNSGRRKEDSTTSYLSLESLSDDIKAVKQQVNDPITGIQKILDEQGSWILKSGKNRLNSLEDNMDMVLDKLKALTINITGVRENERKTFDLAYDNKEAINKRVKALEDKLLGDKLNEFMQKDSDLTFLPSEYVSFDNLKAEEEWDKRAREAYQDHMSEPNEDEIKDKPDRWGLTEKERKEFRDGVWKRAVGEGKFVNLKKRRHDD